MSLDIKKKRTFGVSDEIITETARDERQKAEERFLALLKNETILSFPLKERLFHLFGKMGITVIIMYRAEAETPAPFY